MGDRRGDVRSWGRAARPVFEAPGGRQGRLSIQTDPTLFRSADRMLAQALGFAHLAPNVIVKFPATAAGIAAIEEATARGVSVNATVCFSVAQALAAAEAVERGLATRERWPANRRMGPVVTIMMGRLEDWLRVLTERDGIVADPAALPWSGVAIFKRAYASFAERGYRARLLGAAIRHHLHWSELIGGDVIITLPAVWQRRFNASAVEVRPASTIPSTRRIVDELRRRFPDFERAYEPDGLTRSEFDAFGADRPDAARVHRLVPRAAAPGDRCTAPESRPETNGERFGSSLMPPRRTTCRRIGSDWGPTRRGS